jgi:adenylosuccinate synthase
VIGDIGMEYGATTGRRRQCNYLDIKMLYKMCNVAGVTDLVINKMDILRKVGVWKVRAEDHVVDLHSEDFFCQKIKDMVQPNTRIIFSGSPERL